MPDRPMRVRAVGLIVVALLIVVTLMTAVTLAAVRGQADAVNALRTSSRRSECRVKIVNQDTDEWHRFLARLLNANHNSDAAKIDKYLDLILHQEATQHRINRLCPKPLAQP